jgi:hypothetical protein
MRILWLVLSLSLTGLTIGGWFFVRKLEWAPQEPFDIIGFLWILSNLGPLLAVTVLLLCAGLALYCWVCMLQE